MKNNFCVSTKITFFIIILLNGCVTVTSKKIEHDGQVDLQQYYDKCHRENVDPQNCTEGYVRNNYIPREYWPVAASTENPYEEYQVRAEEYQTEWESVYLLAVRANNEKSTELFEEAIRGANKISNYSPYYSLAQSKISEWSSILSQWESKSNWDSAYREAEKRNFSMAIELANRIPQGASQYNIAQVKIREWKNLLEIEQDKTVSRAEAKGCLITRPVTSFSYNSAVFAKYEYCTKFQGQAYKVIENLSRCPNKRYFLEMKLCEKGKTIAPFNHTLTNVSGYIHLVSEGGINVSEVSGHINENGAMSLFDLNPHGQRLSEKPTHTGFITNRLGHPEGLIRDAIIYDGLSESDNFSYHWRLVKSD